MTEQTKPDIDIEALLEDSVQCSAIDCEAPAFHMLVSHHPACMPMGHFACGTHVRKARDEFRTPDQEKHGIECSVCGHWFADPESFVVIRPI
jgi:hypothetical protein